MWIFSKWAERRRQQTFDSEYRYISRTLAADPSAYEALARFPGSAVSNDAFDAVLEDHAKIKTN